MKKRAQEVTEPAPAPADEATAAETGGEGEASQRSDQAVTAQPAGRATAAQPTTEPPRPRRRGGFRRKICLFCADKIYHIDYKDVGRLRRFVSERAKIDPRRKTGTCAKHQRRLSVALKRARYLALLPYTPEHVRLSGFSSRS